MHYKLTYAYTQTGAGIRAFYRFNKEQLTNERM